MRTLGFVDENSSLSKPEYIIPLPGSTIPCLGWLYTDPHYSPEYSITRCHPEHHRSNKHEKQEGAPTRVNFAVIRTLVVTFTIP